MANNAVSTNTRVAGCGFHHVAIRTSVWDHTMRFYEALGFQRKVVWGEAPQRAAMLDPGDGVFLEIFERDAYTGPPEAAILHLCFRADSVDQATELARNAGAEVTTEPTDIVIKAVEYEGDAATQGVPVRLAFFNGPNGEIVEVFSSELL